MVLQRNPHLDQLAHIVYTAQDFLVGITARLVFLVQRLQVQIVPSEPDCPTYLPGVLFGFLAQQQAQIMENA
jgi:hypothetical protein